MRFRALQPGAGGAYSKIPTVTYPPIEGDTFVKQMLAGDIQSVQPILTLPVATP